MHLISSSEINQRSVSLFFMGHYQRDVIASRNEEVSERGPDGGVHVPGYVLYKM